MVGGVKRQKTQWDKKAVWGGGQALYQWEGNSRMEHNNEFTVKIDGEL